MKKLLAVFSVLVGLLFTGQALAGQHYDAPAFLDDLLERSTQAAQDAQDAQAELRDLEQHIRDRAEWFRTHPADRDRMREKSVELAREVKRLWERRSCIGRVYDEAKAEWQRIAKSLIRDALVDQWEEKWRKRLDACN